jgi:hypothetical protein
MAKPELTQPRVIAAFAIAIIADLIQLPLTAAEATGLGLIPGEFADFFVDCFVMGATTVLLGFHWMLLPSLFVEVIPGLDLIPTWTGCVAFVVWRRKKEQAAPSVVDVQAMKIASTPPPLPTVQTSPPPLLREQNAAERSVEERLSRLNDLLDRKIITQAEYETKRQQLLGEL